ncbi:MAG: N-acetylmuramoyl-L-alanine amidase, partial [Bacteroidota bacterium]
MRTKYLLVSLLFLGIAISYSFLSNKNDTTKPFVVVLDAGHGGHDSGKYHNGMKESKIALSITLKVGAILEKDPNIKVIYTRKTDVFVKLKERGAIANRADADLFVSIHCNAHNSQAHGAETFVLGLHANERNMEVAKKENEVIFLEENFEENYAGYDPNSPESFIGLAIMQEEYLDQSIMLASLVQNNFVNKLKRKDRSVKQAGFIVL